MQKVCVLSPLKIGCLFIRHFTTGGNPIIIKRTLVYLNYEVPINTTTPFRMANTSANICLIRPSRHVENQEGCSSVEIILLSKERGCGDESGS